MAHAESFAERVRRLRERAGLTKTALAGDRYTVSYCSQIESGRRTPSAEALAYLASRLGVSADELRTGVPDGARDELRYDLERARAALRSGDADSALRLADTVLAGARRYALDDVAATAQTVAGGAHSVRGAARDAIELYESALESGRLSARETGLATSALARAYRAVGDLAYAADLVESYLRPSRGEPLDPAVAADMQTVLAQISFERGDVYRAQVASRRALAAAERGVSAPVRAGALWDASRVVAEAGRYSEALELATRARTIIEDLDDQHRLALVHNACAFLCLEFDPPRLDDAHDHLDAAQSLLGPDPAPGDLANVLSERARLALLRGEHEAALRAATQAGALAGSHALGVAKAAFVRARALALMGRCDGALDAFHDAAASFAKAGASRLEAACWREIGELFAERGDAAAAIESLRSGLDAVGTRRSRA